MDHRSLPRFLCYQEDSHRPKGSFSSGPQATVPLDQRNPMGIAGSWFLEVGFLSFFLASLGPQAPGKRGIQLVEEPGHRPEHQIVKEKRKGAQGLDRPCSENQEDAIAQDTTACSLVHFGLKAQQEGSGRQAVSVPGTREKER